MGEFKLTYKIGDLELKLAGSQEFIDKEKEAFLQKLPELIQLQITQPDAIVTNDFEVESTLQESDSIQEKISEDKTDQAEYESIVEFLNSHEFPTKKEMVLGVAYFIDCIEQNPPVMTKKVNALYDEARQQKPNISDYLSKLVKSGDLMPVNGSKGSYKLTKQGIETTNQNHKE